MLFPYHCLARAGYHYRGKDDWEISGLEWSGSIAGHILFIGSLSNPQLPPSPLPQIRHSPAPHKIDLEIVRRKIRRSLPREKRHRLPLEVSAVLRAARRRWNIHHVAVARSPVLVFDGVNHVAVPEDGVSRLHHRNRRERLHQRTVILLVH